MRLLTYFSAVAALAGLLYLGSPLRGANDPIEDLRRDLGVRVYDPGGNPEALAARRKTLTADIAQLRGVGDMRKAAMLNEWRDQDEDRAIATIDRAARDGLMHKLRQVLRDAMKSGDQTARLAAATMVGDMGVSIRGPSWPTRAADNTHEGIVISVTGDKLVMKGTSIDTSEHTFTLPTDATILLDGKPAILNDLTPGQDIRVTQKAGDTAQLTKIEARTGKPDPGGFSRTMAPDLANLIEHDPDPAVRSAAAQALANINPPPPVAAGALRSLLNNNDPVLRRAASSSLTNLMQRISQLNPVHGSKNILGIEATPAEIVQTGRAVVPVAAIGLADPDPQVRRNSADAIRLAGVALLDMLPTPEDRRIVMPPENPLKRQPLGLSETTPEDVRPLAQALLLQATTVARASRDPDEGVRLRACRALEDMAIARQRITGKGGSDITFPPPGGDDGGSSRLDTRHEYVAFARAQTQPQTAAQAIKATLATVPKNLLDPDVAVRLAALDYLEMLGPDAAPAAPAIIAAFRDPNLFVRWAATRVLGKIGPVHLNESIPALARLLSDPDLDVRVTAAAVLEHFGNDAAPAADAIARAVNRGDAEFRIAALRALQAIGPAAADHVPAVVRALNHPDERVRRAAAIVLGRLGPAAQAAEPALRRALNDKDAEVRKNASDALLDIIPTPSSEPPPSDSSR
jgi:HEAT repeat protein